MQLLKLRAQRSGHAKGKDPDRWVFTVPAHIARLLPREQQYECRLTDEGVLFAPVTDVEQPAELPGWVQNGGN